MRFMKTKLAVTIGMIGFLLVMGTFGALDCETISLQQGIIQSSIGIVLVLSGMAIEGVL